MISKGVGVPLELNLTLSISPSDSRDVEPQLRQSRYNRAS